VPQGFTGSLPQALASGFDGDLAAAQQMAKSGSPRELNEMTRAAQAVHGAIVKDWTTHTVQGNWVYFDNIGNWGTDYLDHAATAEFLGPSGRSRSATALRPGTRICTGPAPGRRVR
jgi:hypothetical protein